MTTITREKAREIVDDIRENNGGISEADRVKTPASVLRSLYSVQKKLGAATQTLATKLYSKDTRFVFELIQNAEDNDYTTEEASRDKPFLTFKLHPKHIVIDSNEDGFTEQNVRAICSTGESTKSDSKGYIGEKGIGFKSVFKVASKVHIQSEPFSFVFEHIRGDGGLGMVTPMFEDHQEVPSHIRTRMTLTLADPSEAGKLAAEFYDLPETLLLFLSKLNRITILRTEAPYPPSEITYSKQSDRMQHRVILTKLSVYNRDEHRLRKKTISTYQIKSRILTNLPKHHTRLHSNQAEVVLAFPLDSQSIPIIQNQYVFAFLPIRQVGFTFQIQCDFITQASREDIEKTDRNEAILSGVAETFRDAVLDFCGHPTLQFQWMRYLPNKMVYVPFWAQLLLEITKLLKETRILRPWSGGPLKRPDHLKRVPDYFLDQRGDPLFKDIPNEIYLSPRYSSCDFEQLDVLAVGELSFWDISTRIRADLDDPCSRWKSPATNDDWVTRSASMLMRPFHTNGFIAETLIVRSLLLIPLRDGSWVSGASDFIFHPNSDGIPVPTDLGLRLVDPQALKNPARTALFTNLGLQDCNPQDVIALILEKYTGCSDVSLQASILHLRYLYWYLPRNERDLPKIVHLKDQETRPIHRDSFVVDDSYFERDGTYEVKSLLMQVNLANKIICPGFPVRYINRAYMDAVPSHVRRYDTSWEEWLCRSAGVRNQPKLIKPSTPHTLSDIFLYILKWRKDKLVGTLKAHWALYKKLKSRSVISALCEATVPCEGGMDVPLGTTYLPLPKLVKVCNEVEVYQGMPFLKLPLEMGNDAETDWSFLKMFGVGHEANAGFYLDVLRQFVHTHQCLGKDSEKGLLRIYEGIEEHRKADDGNSIRNFFADENAIHITARKGQNALWTTRSKCFWKAPDFLVDWPSLSDLEGFRGNKKLRCLFHDVLGIKDADWTHYLQQLQAHKDKGLHRNDIQDIYHHLYLEVGEKDWESVRQRFEQFNLIYEPVRNEWFNPSSCLWTEDTQMSGKAALLGTYPDLQAFFVQRLGVKEPDIDMYITELHSLVTDDNGPSVDKVKCLIKQINSFGPSVGALDKLKPYSVFPVQDTDTITRLKTTLDLFVIVDRSRYSSAFTGKVPVLDFDLEEVRELRQTIEALHLEDKYMSRLVVESSTVKDSSKEKKLSITVQKRAYALLRCAFFYGSQSLQYRSLYHKLKATNVYLSDGISKKMTLTLNDICVEVEGAIGIVHIEEDDQNLRIYVPRKARERSLCYCTELPEKLAAQLRIHDVAAFRVLGDILTKRLSVLDEMLDHHGIVRVPDVEPAGQTDMNEFFPEDDTEDHVPHSAPSPPHSPPTPVRRGSSASNLYPGSASSSASRAAPSCAESILTPQSSQTLTRPSSTPSPSLSPCPLKMRENTPPVIATSGHEYDALRAELHLLGLEDLCQRGAQI